MMVHFRKRLSLESIGRINEQILKQKKEEPKAEEENDGDDPPNQGKLLLDASCAPADIRYPTDLNLLNQAREQS